MVPNLKNWELLVENEDWSLLKAKVLAHLINCLRSSPFELYGRSDNVYETCLFSRNFSNLNKIFKTQKGQPGATTTWPKTVKSKALSRGTKHGFILEIPP